MPLVIKDTSHVPPENWRYKVDATGFTVETKYYALLYPEIVKHCTSNNVPVPDEQSVIDYLCANITIPCYEGMTPLINKFTLNIPKPPPVGCCGGRKKKL